MKKGSDYRKGGSVEDGRGGGKKRERTRRDVLGERVKGEETDEERLKAQ
jgi:hypothetical protein